MEIVPISVGVTSRAWDQQNIDLTSAAGLIQDAGTGGFTAAVSGPAGRFTQDWQRYATALAARCETQADGLRGVIETYLQTELTIEGAFNLRAYTQEQR